MKKLISITILLLIPTFLFSQNEIKIIGILKLKNNSFFIENQFKRYVFYSDSINLKKFKNKNVIVEVKKLYETKPTNYILNKIGERNNVTYYKAEVSNIILNNNYDGTLNETENSNFKSIFVKQNPFW